MDKRGRDCSPLCLYAATVQLSVLTTTRWPDNGSKCMSAMYPTPKLSCPHNAYTTLGGIVICRDQLAGYNLTHAAGPSTEPEPVGMTGPV